MGRLSSAIESLADDNYQNRANALLEIRQIRKDDPAAFTQESFDKLLPLIFATDVTEFEPINWDYYTPAPPPGDRRPEGPPMTSEPEFTLIHFQHLWHQYDQKERERRKQFEEERKRKRPVTDNIRFIAINAASEFLKANHDIEPGKAADCIFELLQNQDSLIREFALINLPEFVRPNTAIASHLRLVLSAMRTRHVDYGMSAIGAFSRVNETAFTEDNLDVALELVGHPDDYEGIALEVIRCFQRANPSAFTSRNLSSTLWLLTNETRASVASNVLEFFLESNPSAFSADTFELVLGLLARPNSSPGFLEDALSVHCELNQDHANAPAHGKCIALLKHAEESNRKSVVAAISILLKANPSLATKQSFADLLQVSRSQGLFSRFLCLVSAGKFKLPAARQAVEAIPFYLEANSGIVGLREFRTIVSYLSDPDSGVRHTVVSEILPRIWEQNRKLAGASHTRSLLRLAKSKKPEIRHTAITAVGMALDHCESNTSPRVLRRVTAWIKDADRYVRRAALQALVSYLKQTNDIVDPKLFQVVSDAIADSDPEFFGIPDAIEAAACLVTLDPELATLENAELISETLKAYCNSVVAKKHAIKASVDALQVFMKANPALATRPNFDLIERAARKLK